MYNPIQKLKNILGNYNPEQVTKQIINNNSNPMLQNLIKMAQTGDTQSIENFARNICKERGRDFDKEFNDFMSNFK